MADGRSYKVMDETRYDGLTPTEADALYAAERAGQEPKMVTLTWDDLAAVNDPEVMEDIALLQVGEKTILGMCDPIERVS